MAKRKKMLVHSKENLKLVHGERSVKGNEDGV